MTLKPIHDRIVVQRIAEDEMTPGGIIIPQNAKEKPTRATVIAAGPGALTEQGALRPMSVKAGDEVLFGKYNGSEVRIEGTDYVILHESEVLAVIEHAAATEPSAQLDLPSETAFTGGAIDPQPDTTN